MVKIEYEALVHFDDGSEYGSRFSDRPSAEKKVKEFEANHKEFAWTAIIEYRNGERMEENYNYQKKKKKRLYGKAYKKYLNYNEEYEKEQAELMSQTDPDVFVPTPEDEYDHGWVKEYNML